jgi:hypothetical protein
LGLVFHRTTPFLPGIASLFLTLAAGCGGSSSSEPTVGAVRLDPCRPVAVVLDADVSAEREAGVRAAMDLWNVAAGTRLDLGGAAAAPAVDADGAAPPTLPVRFETAAAPSHGFFDPVRGEVLINDDLVARALAVTIAHELGHAFGLVHVNGRPSVMNPGNLDVEPNAADVDALADIWGRCGTGPAE